MNSSISNIAWPHAEDDAALALAAELGFGGIEIAPVKVFGPLQEVSLARVREYREFIEALGLTASSMQGLLFGLQDVHLFAGDIARANLREALARVADVAAMLGAGACVFGAPSLRNPGDLAPDAANDIAVTFFRDVGDLFVSAGAVLCIEANPERYGCRFITQTSEAARFVEEVDSPGIRMQLDTGTIFINQENPRVITSSAPVTGHVHVSAPDLAPVALGLLDHQSLAHELHSTAYRDWIAIEMRATPDWRHNMESSKRLLDSVYLQSG